jgi:ankyrin repeat protein
VVQLLVGCDNIDLEAADGWKQTAFHIAARNGDEGIIKAIMEAFQARGIGLDVNRRTNRGTLLCTAADGGHNEVVQLLLSLDDIDIEAADEHNRSPFFRQQYRVISR